MIPIILTLQGCILQRNRNIPTKEQLTYFIRKWLSLSTPLVLHSNFFIGQLILQAN